MRWICILPAAVLGGLVAKYAFGLVAWLALGRGGGVSGSEVAYYLRVLLYYLPKEAAFVVVGAAVAPRRRGMVAVALAVVAIALSLLVHVAGQANPGTVNYTHFATESAGALLGAVCLLCVEFRKTTASARAPTDESAAAT